ncbi:MAG: peptidylprolyl isomerase, partial [Dolichospermum sp.]
MTNLITSHKNQVLQWGDRTLAATEVLSLISEYQLMPILIKEMIIDQAIAAAEIVYTPEEEKQVCEQLTQQYQGIDQQGENFQQLKIASLRQNCLKD